MTPERWQEVKQLLDRMLAFAPAERGAALEQVGGNDPQLRAEVESLLQAHEVHPDFLDQPYSSTAGLGTLGDSDAWIGRVLGPYRLEQHIGEGGMGTVYRAVRADGLYERSVAVKLIRSGLSTRPATSH